LASIFTTFIPQAQGGTDDIDNAAPLCQNCHDRFGANPEKRKEIRQMRDWWYDVVEEKYPTSHSQFEKINELILKFERTHRKATKQEIKKLRKELIEAIKAVRRIQEQAVEDLNTVPVVNIPRQANTAIFASIASSSDFPTGRKK
jgi:uncharacterized protein (DUF3084 family)